VIQPISSSLLIDSLPASVLQNVNKLNTKASLRLSLDKAKSSGWLPGFVISELVKTVRSTTSVVKVRKEMADRNIPQPYFSATPPSLLISSSATRLAASNRADSIAKLHDVICTTAQSMIVKPTSDEQKSKVKDLIGRDAARRRAEKVKKSMKKDSRRKGGWD
jgi:peptidyl-tRNA hydrolase ICT1